MKAIIFLIICLFSLNLYAQEDIKSSGKKTFNISKKEVKSKTEVETKKVSEKESGKKTFNISNKLIDSINVGFQGTIHKIKKKAIGTTTISNTQKETKANVEISKEEGSGKDIYLISKTDETAPEIIITFMSFLPNLSYSSNTLSVASSPSSSGLEKEKPSIIKSFLITTPARTLFFPNLLLKDSAIPKALKPFLNGCALIFHTFYTRLRR